jgi:predicted ATPase/DNA-binding SARP family transcriptional activator
LSELNLSFLGSPHIARSQTGNITFPKRKALALLAYLVIESEHSHSRESLLGLFWPELPTAAAQNNLRVVLSQLRKGMGEESDDSQPYLIGKRFDLGFNPHSDYTLDVTLFLDLVAATRAHQHSNRPDCSECAERLAQAIELVRGEFLEGFSLGDAPAFDEWLFVQRERLHLQITAALEELGIFHERAGNSADAETYVRRLLEFDPLRESAHCQLMRLLADAGQRSAALDQYETCRRLLANELGVAPAPETVLLAEQIRALAPTQTTSQGPRHNLPPALTRFIGRSAESARLQELLTRESGGVLTLTGPGGVGKTRLALQVAHDLANRFSDGVWLVELAGVQDASAVPAAVASALNVVPDARRSLTRMIGDYLRGKSILLVFDNCEHLLEACSQLVTALRLAAPNLAVLATSRTPLRLDEERVVRLRPFPSPVMDSSKTLTVADALQYDSIQLFSNCAAQSLLSFTLDDSNAGSVAQICRNLDGIPLAIELAAARAGSMPVEAIAQRLDQRFRWLDSKTPGKLPRQRTLHALIDWSYDLLDEQEKALFCRLAVFAGGWTLEAAEAVSEDEDACADILGRLVDQSLVVFGDDPAGKRYHMHETIRQFAAAKLAELGDEVKMVVFQSHSQLYLSMLEYEEKQLKGINAALAGAALRLEIDNIRQAWHWAVDAASWEQLRRSAPGLAAFYNHLGLPMEGVQLLQMGIDSPELEPSTEACILPFLMATQLNLLSSISTLEEILPLIKHLLEITQHRPELAHPEAEAYYSWSLGLLNQDSEPQKARAYLDRAFASAANINDPELEAFLLCESGRNYLYDGQFEKAVEILQQALAIFKSLEHIPGQAQVYSRLAPAYAEAYNLGPALVCDQEALRLYSQINYRLNLNRAHNNLAETFVLLGAYEQAKEHALKSLSISREQGNKVNEINTLSVYAAILDGLGQTEEAEKQYRTAISTQKELSMNWSLSYSLLDWGDFQLRAGRLTEAEKTFKEALAINSDMDHLRMTTQSKLAMVYLAQGKTEQALAFASEIWQAVEPERGQGLPFPIKTMFECFTIFQACNDARAKNALDQAADVLKRTADGIEDPEMREAFLNNVPVNRSLQQAMHNPLR